MAKQKEKKRRKARGIMGRSDIPYAQRLNMKHHVDDDGNIITAKQWREQRC